MASLTIEAAIPRVSYCQLSQYLNAYNLNINNLGCRAQTVGHCINGTSPSSNDKSYLWNHFKILQANVQNSVCFGSVYENNTQLSGAPNSSWEPTPRAPFVSLATASQVTMASSIGPTPPRLPPNPLTQMFSFNTRSGSPCAANGQTSHSCSPNNRHLVNTSPATPVECQWQSEASKAIPSPSLKSTIASLTRQVTALTRCKERQ